MLKAKSGSRSEWYSSEALKFLANLSIRNKVAGTILVAILVSLGVGFTLVILYNLKQFEQDLLNTTELIARATGDYNAIHLYFSEPEYAEETLHQLAQFPYITDAHLYTTDGQLFASYPQDAAERAPERVFDGLSEISGGFVLQTAPVLFDGKRHGTIFVRGTTAELAERQRQHLMIMAGLMAALVTASVLLAYLLQGFISRPILHLARQTQRISAEEDYSVRVHKFGNDEIGILYDGFNEMLAKIQRRQEDLERSNRDLDQFAYVASHDLKAPLRAIATLAGWIEDDVKDKLSDDAREQMRLLRSRVARMDALIEGVLHYSRVGRMDAEGEEVDVGELIEELIEVQAPPAGFKIYLDPDLPTITTRRLRLSQVFSNLINNAIKYHDRDQGRIDVRVERVNGDYEFTVADDGPGIASEHHERVFVMFQTLQPRDEVESTGVGLALVKKLVEEEGGRITLESKPGEGARFRFTWPAVARGDRPAVS